jgi:hypothetical protein
MRKPRRCNPSSRDSSFILLQMSFHLVPTLCKIVVTEFLFAMPCSSHETVNGKTLVGFGG